MGFTDNKYQRIHAVGEVVAEWADLVCQRYRLGKRRHGSLHSLSSTRVVDDTVEGQKRTGDGTWQFATEQSDIVLMLFEMQSRQERFFLLRALQYIINQYLNVLDAQTGKGRKFPAGLPPVVMVILYTGESRWHLGSWSDMFHPGFRAVWGNDLQLPIVFYDIKHMDARDVPQSQALQLMFRIERELAKPTVHSVPLGERIGGIRNQPIQDALFAFMRTTMSRWPARNDMVESPDWNAISDIKEMIVAMKTIPAVYSTLLEEGRQEGRREGRQESRREGQVLGLCEMLLYYNFSLQEVVAIGCDLLAMTALPTAGAIMETHGNPAAIRDLIPVDGQAREHEGLQQTMQQLLAQHNGSA